MAGMKAFDVFRYCFFVFFCFCSLDLSVFPASVSIPSSAIASQITSFPPQLDSRLMAPLLEGSYQNGQTFKGTAFTGLFHLGKDYCVAHSGISGNSLEGTSFYSIAPGKVIDLRYSEPAYRRDGVGNYLIINHGDGVVAVYMHLAKIYVKKDWPVTRDMILGEAGDGTLHPPPNCAHLHIEIRKNGTSGLNVFPNLRYGYVSRDGTTRLTPQLGSERDVLAWIDTVFYNPDAVLTPRTVTPPSAGAGTQPLAAQYRKLLPVDEAGKIPAFLQFRTALLQAIDRRDAEYLIRVLDKDIKLSFGSDSGVQRFIDMWNPRSPGSAIWKELGDVLRLGGTFGYGGHIRDTFWAPYVFTSFPKDLDAFNGDAAIVSGNVRMRAEPSAASSVIATLSYEVVKLGPYDPNPVMGKIGEFSYPWKQIRLADQRTGYVYGRYVRSPLDYRAAFNKINGAWKLSVFLNGD